MSQEQHPPFTPYPAYKPSGVEWLGNVPSHWDVRRGKTFLRTVNVRSKTGNEILLTVSAEHGVIPRDSANVTMFKAESYVGYKLCWPGDLVINSLWAWAHGLAVSQYHGIVSSAYGVYRLRSEVENYSPQFFHYLVRSIPFQYELQIRSKGIWISRLQLTDSAFLSAPFPIPPPSEQRAIAAYLDRKGEIVRRHADVTARLIACLRELRQAEIRQAVTRGLDEDAPLKASGVEWLGDVPAHWEVRRLKYWVDINKKTLPETTNPDYEFRYIEIGGVSTGKLSEEPALIRFRNAPSRARRIVRRGDTIVSTVRTYLKAIWFAEENEVENIVCSTGFATLTPRSDTFPKFVSYVAQSDEFTNQVTAESFGVAYPAISESKLGVLRVPVPPLTEQAAIAAHLDARAATIDAAIAHYERMAELVSEYWARLSADAVTGQVNVRGLV